MSSGNTQFSPPLRGGIIGFGGVALGAHLPAWRRDPRFRIDAVVEPVPERIRMAERLLPEAVIHPDMESLIAAQCVDFVDICTPPCFHEDMMLKACEAGLHVFCEKPLPPSPDGLSRLLEAGRVSGRVLFMVNNWKFAPLWDKVIELVKAKKIGDIKTLSLSVLRTSGSGGGISDWRRCSRIAGGGILLDHGWHNLYLIMAVMDDRPLSLSAQMEFSGGEDSPTEETADLFLQFPAAEARLHLTRRAACRRNDGVIIGERGVLRINDDHLLLETSAGVPPVRYDFPEPLSGGSHHPAWMKTVVENFYREVRTSHSSGGNFAEAWWCAHLTDLAYLSHRRDGRLVSAGAPPEPGRASCSGGNPQLDVVENAEGG